MQASNDTWSPGSAGARTDQRWFVPELITLPLAARRCLVRNALNGTALELSSGEQAVLTACEGCRTLAEHEARVAARLRAPEEHIPAIRELLERCARQGLFVSLPRLGGASRQESLRRHIQNSQRRVPLKSKQRR